MHKHDEEDLARDHSRRLVRALSERAPLIGGRLFKVPEASAELNVCRDMVYKLLRAGAIAYVRVGSDIRIPRAALDAYLQSRLVARGGAKR